MKLAISNIAWKEHEDEEVYSLMKKHGFNGLEIAPTRFFYKNPYDDLVASSEKSVELKQKGIDLVSIQSILFGKADLTLFDSEKSRCDLLAYLKKAVDFAESMGIPNIVFGNPKNRVIKNSSTQYEIAIAFFKELASYAHQKGATIAIEPNPKEYNTNFLNTTKEALTFVEAVNTAGCSLQLDLSTMIINKEDFSVLDSAIPLASHIHISEPFLEAVGGPRKEIAQLLEKVKLHQYRHWVSIEMKSHSSGESIAQVEKALHYVSSLI